MLKRLARKAFGAMGYDVVPHGGRSRIILQDALEKLLPSVPLVLDVGANVGQYRDYLRRDLRYTGRIVSFEPSPADFAICEARAADDSAWQVFPFAIGEIETSLPFNIMEASDLNSFRGLAKGDTPFHRVRIERTVNVSVRRLDTLLPELGIDPSGCLLKTDTQGFELEVIRGSPIEKLAAIQLEVAQVQIYDGVPDMLTALAEVRYLGFDIAAMSPVVFNGLAVMEFDCLLTRKVKPAGK